MNIIKIIKKIIKKLLKIAIILLILIGIGFGAYTFWIVKQSEEKLTFFLEGQPKEFKGIEWKPVKNIWQTLTTNTSIQGYGDAQEGYDSMDRLVFRYVQLNTNVPVVAYFFNFSQINVASVHWIIECEPKKVQLLGDSDLLACWENGKSMSTSRMVSRGRLVVEEFNWINEDGFIYRHPPPWYFDWDKLERNRNLKGSILD